jgi:hypothetical protein
MILRDAIYAIIVLIEFWCRRKMLLETRMFDDEAETLIMISIILLGRVCNCKLQSACVMRPLLGQNCLLIEFISHQAFRLII